MAFDPKSPSPSRNLRVNNIESESGIKLCDNEFLDMPVISISGASGKIVSSIHPIRKTLMNRQRSGTLFKCFIIFLKRLLAEISFSDNLKILLLRIIRR